MIIDTKDYLAHHGIAGQKWGKRRYQNPDGSLTPEGYIHYGYKNEKGQVTKEGAEKFVKDVHDTINAKLESNTVKLDKNGNGYFKNYDDQNAYFSHLKRAKYDKFLDDLEKVGSKDEKSRYDVITNYMNSEYGKEASRGMAVIMEAQKRKSFANKATAIAAGTMPVLTGLLTTKAATTFLSINGPQYYKDMLPYGIAAGAIGAALVAAPIVATGIAARKHGDNTIKEETQIASYTKPDYIKKDQKMDNYGRALK